MAKKSFIKKDSNQPRINDEIFGYDIVRIVGEDIESKVVSLSTAKSIAESKGLDLVEINTTSSPPVLKICDYDKLLYEKRKIEKKMKQNTVSLKEIQLSVNIAKHDIETKANQARGFLEKGHKVKVVLTMRGRELTHREENKKSIYEFVVMLEDCSLVESIKDEGNRTIVILKHKK
jgi:translation initiation factor IF-3